MNSNEPKQGPRFDPGAETRKAIITLAADKFCTICGGSPCYLLATAALAAIQEEFIYNEDLVSIVRYTQNLERVHQCLARHKETTSEVWHLDQHFRVSEEAMNFLKEEGIDVRHLQEKSHKENGNPQAKRE